MREILLKKKTKNKNKRKIQNSELSIAGRDYLSSEVRRVTAVHPEHPESDVSVVELAVTMMLIVMGVLELHSRPQGGPFDSQGFQRRLAARHRELQQRLAVQRVPCNSATCILFWVIKNRYIYIYMLDIVRYRTADSRKTETAG